MVPRHLTSQWTEVAIEQFKRDLELKLEDSEESLLSEAQSCVSRDRADVTKNDGTFVSGFQTN